MIISVHLVLLVLGLVLLILDGVGLPNPPRFKFVPWGLFFIFFSQLVRF
jgi:hypothetical protein